MENAQPKMRAYEPHVTLVFSPDDSGWYAQETNFNKARSRVSRRVWPNEKALRQALTDETHKWERWT